MSPAVANPPGTSETLSDRDWQPRQAWQSGPRRPDARADIASETRSERIAFGQGTLIFEQPIPSWSRDLLAKVSELGELEKGWDSYGAQPVDPQCAQATVKLLLQLLNRHTPQPSIVPTTRGGIQLEWHRAGADLEIEIESPTKFHVFFGDQRTGKEDDTTLSDNLQPLVPLLQRLSEAD